MDTGEEAALRKVISELTTAVAVNTEVVSGLRRVVDDIQRNAVPRREWELARAADLAQIAMVAKAVSDFEDAEEEKEKGAAAFRRQVMVVAIAAVMTALGSLIVALILLILKGGP